MIRAVVTSHLVAPPPAAALRRTGLHRLTPRPARATATVAKLFATARPAASSSRTAEAASIALAGGAALGLWRPDLVAAAAPFVGGAAVGTALLAGLSLDSKVRCAAGQLRCANNTQPAVGCSHEPCRRCRVSMHQPLA